jgi:Flp pilus assembly protein TadD
VPLLNLGDAWAAAGRFPDALAAYQDALARDPLAVEAHAKRGTVLERLGRLAEARMEYETYVDRGGANAASVRRRIERLLESETRG